MNPTPQRADRRVRARAASAAAAVVLIGLGAAALVSCGDDGDTSSPS
ncbi:hypothetical protein ACIGEZ_27870 [Streptomyces sp. NPDC085481]